MNFFNEYNSVYARRLSDRKYQSASFERDARSDFTDMAHMYALMAVDQITVDNRVKNYIDLMGDYPFKDKILRNGDVEFLKL